MHDGDDPAESPQIGLFCNGEITQPSLQGHPFYTSSNKAVVQFSNRIFNDGKIFLQMTWEAVLKNRGRNFR